VASGLTLDSGALIAAEKHVRRFLVIWAAALERGARITVPAVVLAQVWRGNSPAIARLLPACDIQDLDEPAAKLVGKLLARSRTADVIDAAVVVGAAARGDAIVTSDPGDIGRLVIAVGRQLTLLAV
jgi:predicted nucleic acid-binding protein